MKNDLIKKIKWKEFFLNEVFSNISSSKKQIDKIRLKMNGEKIFPYITRTDKKNGIDSFIPEQKEHAINKGNVITVGLDTQTVFYQKQDFYTGQNIQVISDPKLNETNAMFLIPLIEKQMSKFNWGGNGATLFRLRRLKILLPVNDEEDPDWEFMEQYMKEIEKEVKPDLKFKKHKITDYRKIEDVEWKEFVIKDLFNVKSGVRLTKKDMRNGNLAFVGATDSNNGVTNFVSNTNNSLDSNVLGVNYNGSVVENFYHPYKAVFSDDVKRLSLKNKEGNQYLYLFIKTMILQQKEKYMYAYKFNARRMNKQKIMLPVDDNDEPDWGFMEQYMKRVENNLMEDVVEI